MKPRQLIERPGGDLVGFKNSVPRLRRRVMLSAAFIRLPEQDQVLGFDRGSIQTARIKSDGRIGAAEPR
jgi:hypothetical protein